jgi:hypothetical protein
MNKERQIIDFSNEEDPWEFVFNNDDFKLMYDKITGSGRWTTYKELVVQRLSDGKFFMASYSQGATESQDVAPFENDKRILTEVFPVEKRVIVYE